jgi:hypothetical protein
MRYLITFSLLALILQGCSYNLVESYPNWAELPKMSSDCAEVSGIYGEANPSESGNAVPGMWAFDFLPPDNLRVGDNSVRSRNISIKFASDRSLQISYLVDGQEVRKKIIMQSKCSCNTDGFRIELRNHYGTVFDKIPNVGKQKVVATLWRDNNYLYVKTTWHVFALDFYIVPHWGKNENWYRFPVRS